MVAAKSIMAAHASRQGLFTNRSTIRWARAGCRVFSMTVNGLIR
jgi:hypothetical protein